MIILCEAKQSRSKNHLDNKKQDDILIPAWFFKEEPEPNRKKIPKKLKQTARDIIKLDDKELHKRLAEKRIIQIILVMEN